MSANSTNQDLEGRKGDDVSCTSDVMQKPPCGLSEPRPVIPEERTNSKPLAELTDPRVDSVAPRGVASFPSSSGKRAFMKKKKSVKIPLTIEVEETPSLYERMRAEGPLSEPSLRSSQKRPREDDGGLKGDEGRTLSLDGQSPQKKILRASEGTGPAATLGLKMISTDSDLLSNRATSGAYEGRTSTSGGQPAVVSGRHHFSFEYRGGCPIAMDPSACEELLGRISATAADVPELKLGGSCRGGEEIAAAHVLLMSLEGQREKGHRKEADELRQGILLRDQVVEVHKREAEKLKTELDAERERLHATETKLASRVLKVGRLKARAKKLRDDLACSDKAVARREAELDVRTRELATRTQELRECEGKLGSMGTFCRRRTKRMLKDQLAAFGKSYRDQSEDAVRTVLDHLAARGKWEAADRLLSQAQGARQALMGLQEDGVPIPDSAIARFAKEEAKYTQEREKLVVEALSSESFDVKLPSDLGIPNLERIDFSAGVLLESEEDAESLDDSSEDESDDAGGDIGEEEEASSDEEFSPPGKPELKTMDVPSGASLSRPPVTDLNQGRIAGSTRVGSGDQAVTGPTSLPATETPTEMVPPVTFEGPGVTADVVVASTEVGPSAASSGPGKVVVVEDSAGDDAVPELGLEAATLCEVTQQRNG